MHYMALKQTEILSYLTPEYTFFIYTVPSVFGIFITRSRETYKVVVADEAETERRLFLSEQKQKQLKIFKNPPPPPPAAWIPAEGTWFLKITKVY